MRFVLGLSLVMACADGAAAATCESLASLSLPDATITSAQVVAAGEFVPPSGGRAGRGANPFKDLPPFCRVAATLTPTSDSDIKVEVWLPASGWNGNHVWSDPLVGPLTSVDYYTSVAKALGRIDDPVRLFMVPGMGHCGGGEGPNTFDMLGALEQWVERGKTPDQIVASHSTGGAVDRTRPLCPYPQVATYTGAGSIDEAASFICR
ncbi:MAG: hypothetical protein DMG01_11905 [Acidobacteria bacterium]|nr:MAG: hypothetical protein DMG01_11905 [Acidobacteriota bacterium]